MSLVSIAVAALLFAAPSLQKDAPRAYVYNGCDFDVNLWSVVADKPGTKVPLKANGGRYNETYRIPDIGGVSLKLTPNDECTNKVPITQFEYTYVKDKGTIYYDISDINCVEFSEDKPCPFRKGGMYMHSSKGCPSVSCATGAKCADAYNAWNDDFATKACNNDADIHLYLCMTELPKVKNLDEIAESAAGAVADTAKSVVDSAKSIASDVKPSSSPAVVAAAAAAPSVPSVAAAPVVATTPSPVPTPSPTPTPAPVKEEHHTVIEEVQEVVTIYVDAPAPEKRHVHHHHARHPHHRR